MDKQTRDIEKYLKGELTPAEMHALEKRALSDPFLAEALEGAEQISHTDFLADVAGLNAQISKRKTTTWTWLVRIAASLLLLTVAAFIVWTTFDQQTEQHLALEQTTITPDTLTQTPAPQTQQTSPQTELQQTPSPAESKKETDQNLSPLRQRSKKSSESRTENTSAEPAPKVRQNNRMKALPREKRLDQQAEVARIDPGKKDELQSPSAKEIRLAERYITAVDAQPTIVTGRVMSAEDGTPLPNVNVALKGTSVATKTDANGRYAIVAGSQNKTLVYSSEGLESTEVKVEGIDSTYLPVKLEITEEAQKEEAVEAPGFREYGPTNVLTIPAHPETGNRAFKQYLQKNYQYPEEAKETKVEGTVVIEFKVDVSGALSEFRIVRGIGKGCDEEVIRLILQGAKWVPTTRDGVIVSDKARVRFKFQLGK